MTENDNSPEERAQEIQQLGKWIMSQDDAKIQEMEDDGVLFIPLTSKVISTPHKEG